MKRERLFITVLLCFSLNAVADESEVTLSSVMSNGPNIVVVHEEVLMGISSPLGTGRIVTHLVIDGAVSIKDVLLNPLDEVALTRFLQSMFEEARDKRLTLLVAVSNERHVTVDVLLNHLTQIEKSARAAGVDDLSVLTIYLWPSSWRSLRNGQTARTEIVDTSDKQKLKVEVLERGIFESKHPIDIVHTDLLPGGRRGLAHDVRLIESTNRIPARIGVEFGLRYRIHLNSDDDNVTLTEVIVFPGPGLEDPQTGKTKKKIKYDIGESSGVSWATFKFHETWEIVPGTWVFQFWYRDQKLLEQAFEIYQVDRENLWRK